MNKGAFIELVQKRLEGGDYASGQFTDAEIAHYVELACNRLFRAGLDNLTAQGVAIPDSTHLMQFNVAVAGSTSTTYHVSTGQDLNLLLAGQDYSGLNTDGTFSNVSVSGGSGTDLEVEVIVEGNTIFAGTDIKSGISFVFPSITDGTYTDVPVDFEAPVSAQFLFTVSVTLGTVTNFAPNVDLSGIPDGTSFSIELQYAEDNMGALGGNTIIGATNSSMNGSSITSIMTTQQGNGYQDGDSLTISAGDISASGDINITLTSAYITETVVDTTPSNSYPDGYLEINLPTAPISISNGVGLFKVYPKDQAKGGMAREFIPVPNGQMFLMQNSLVSEQFLNSLDLYEWPGGLQVFIKPAEGSISLMPADEITVWMVVGSFTSLQDTDPIPFPAEYLQDVLIMAIELLTNSVEDKTSADEN